MTIRFVVRAAWISLLILPVAGSAWAQDLPCETDFDVLAATTMRNYVGYPIEVSGRRDAEYAEMITRVRGSARLASSTAACIEALREYTDWFDDPHLFVTEFPRYSEEQLAVFRADAERHPLAREAVLARLADGDSLDPIEGVWYDEAGEIAVVRDSAVGSNRFLGVVLSSTSDAWEPGDVKARIRRVGPNEYRLVLRMDDRSPRHVEGAIHKGGLLFRFAPHAWGRRAPIGPHDAGLLHPTDPRAPTLTFAESGAPVISIPSHDPKYQVALDSLLQAHAADLQRSRMLVVDLRGNEGGGARTTNGLEPYYWSPSGEAPPKPVGPPVVLASPANLEAFQRWTEWYDPVPAWLSALLRDLEERTGEIVSYDPSDGDNAPAADPPVVHENPRHVAILIDGGVVSAGEAFVLKARRHDRVTVYGQPTAGSIDYQNVQLLPLASRGRGFFLGYPTQAATRNLPQDGINRTGVEPDVPMAEDVEDPIGFILCCGTPAAGRTHGSGAR